MLKQCIESIIEFVFHDSQYYQTEIQANNAIKKPNRKRQKILREQGFLYLLSQIVDITFPKIGNLNKVKFLSKLFIINRPS